VKSGVVLAGLGVLVELAFSPRGKAVGSSKAAAAVFSPPAEIQVLAFEGPLFFIGVEQLRRRIKALAQKPSLVLDFSAVTMVDETGALALGEFVQRLQGEGQSIYLGGLQRKPLRMLIRMGVVDRLGRRRVCKHLDSAIWRATQELEKEV